MNKTKNSVATGLMAVLLGAATSCQKAENTNTASNQTVSNTSQPGNTATATPANAPTDSGTPTDAYKAAYAARKNKDVSALKKLMSKDILEFFAIIADTGDGKKQTLDEVLMELCEKPQAATDDTRNEKINGDKATVEYLNEDGEWETMDLVKEDGAWKLTIEKPDQSSPATKKPKK